MVRIEVWSNSSILALQPYSSFLEYYACANEHTNAKIKRRKHPLSSTGTYLLTFDAASRVPVSYAVVPFAEVTEVAYPPADDGVTNSLIVADSKGMLHLVTGKKVHKARSQDRKKASQPAQTLKDVFNVPAAVAGATASVSSAPSVLASGDSFDKMLQAPSHILPPPSLMFRVFLKDVHKSQADNQSRDSKQAPTSSPSAEPAPTTVTKTTPKSSEFPISDITIKPADLAAVVSTDTRLGSFAELGRLFQEASGAASTRSDRKQKVKSKGGQPEKAAATATTADQTPQPKKKTPHPKKKIPHPKKKIPQTEKQTPQTKKQTPHPKKKIPQTEKQTPQLRRSTRKKNSRAIGNQNTESTRKVKDTKKKNDDAKAKTKAKAVEKNDDTKASVSSTPIKTKKESRAKSTIKKKKQTLQTPKSRVKTRSSSRYSLRKK